MPDGICGALIPMRSLGRLLSRQNLNEAWCEIVEFVSVIDMLVQRHAVELGEHVNRANVGVQAVADGDINERVLATKRHGGLGPFLGQGEEPVPAPPP